MVWVYGHYEYLCSYSVGINFTEVDPRAVRVKIRISFDETYTVVCNIKFNLHCHIS